MTGFDFVSNFSKEINLADKIPKIVASLADSPFHTVVTTPAVIVYATSANDQLVINPMQFRLSVQRETTYEGLLELLAPLIPSLEVVIDGEHTMSNLHIVDTRPAGGASAFSTMLDYIPPFARTLPNIDGIGFRFLFKSPNFPAQTVFNEFKCEPLIVDPSKFFFESFTNFTYIPGFDVMKIFETSYIEFDRNISSMYNKLIEG